MPDPASLNLGPSDSGDWTRDSIGSDPPPGADWIEAAEFDRVIAERDRYKDLLQIAREAIRYAVEDHHLDGDECLCDAARSTLAAGLRLTEEAPDA